ncbi:UDP-glucuronosyltransferase 2C1-like [Hippoglossus hippoglossus]|uniref:UDP-glucuronosyltransferase 2C1-like n=1 Tax=Hippoglossus hippoglossus TaxID=8267 RepID=UPI00148BA5E5|nr:UDP-glucuronosyltransferase 2C1-like [Hippoglossus hippoglossus]
MMHCNSFTVMDQSSVEFELKYVRNPLEGISVCRQAELRLPLSSMGTMPLSRVCGIFVLLSVGLISFTPPCHGGNILVFPIDGSHWINMKLLLEELHARGHSLTVIRDSKSWYIPEESPLYTSITIKMNMSMENFVDEYLLQQMRPLREGASFLTSLKMKKDFLSMISQIHSVWYDAISQLLDDENMVKRLKDAQYDLVLTDPAVAPGVLLAKYLKLPLVLNVRWIPSGDGQFAIAPSPLSYIPVPGSGLTDKMNFMQRIKNLLFYGIILFQHKFLIGPIYDVACSKYIEGECDIISMLQDADIWLFRSDFVFDFPRPTMPNVIYIGGFQCKPAQPLPADLEQFVQSAGEHGVIIMTLGTLVNALPKEAADDIASVFAKMPQKVIWRHKGERPSTLGNNTLIVDWMPQRDLLGHPQTKVFVAHGGTNGVQEAIYHGVPVLGLPLFFDQFDNLVRLRERRAAKIIELGELNGQSFEQGLQEVLLQDSYRLNMQRLSSLHRDQPIAPMDHAIFWVEYVIRHKGAAHLRTEAYKMPWYSYYSLDVLLVLLTAAAALLLFTVAVFWFLCCRSRRKTKTKAE